MPMKFLGNDILKTVALKRVFADEYVWKISLHVHEKGDEQVRNKEILGNRESIKCFLVDFNILPFNG